MPVFTCHTLFAGRKHTIVDEASLAKFRPEALTEWTFTHKTISAADELAASAVVIDLRLIGPTGAKETRAVWIAKGRTYAVRSITEWNVPGPNETILPITPENVDTVVPTSVLAEFGAYCELGVADDEAIEAAKKP